VQRQRGGHHAGDGGQLGQPVAFGAGSAAGGGAAWWWQPVQAGVGAQPQGDGHLPGQLPQPLAGVGAVTDQVDAARAEVAADQLDQLDGQVQPPRGVSWPPQPGQDRQAHRPGAEGQVDQHAQHHPVVGPGDAVPAWGQRVVVPLRPEDLAAGPAHEGVVTHQPHRRVGAGQHGQDQLQQAKAELVGRPAGLREEAVRAGMMPDLLKARATEDAGDGVQSRLGPKPAGQPAEGGEGWGGEAAAEAAQQAGDRSR